MLTKLLPLDSDNRRLFAVFLMLLAASCMRPPYIDYFGMQHAPTVVAVVALLAAERRHLLDRTGFALVIAFLLLHTLGARYLYSYVPYDDWSQRLFDTKITDYFGFKRNHYDRLVHFGFGLLLAYPLVQFFKLNLKMENVWPTTLSVCVIAAASAVYEIGEWLTALVFAPDWAEAYTGQQGDPWDAQCDMALAITGGIIAAIAVYLRERANFPRSQT